MSSNFWITINDDLIGVSNTAACLLAALSTEANQGKVLSRNYLNAILGTRDMEFEPYRKELIAADLLRIWPCSYEMATGAGWGWRYVAIPSRNSHKISGYFSIDRSINNDIKGFLLRLSCLVDKKSGELLMTAEEAASKLKMTVEEYDAYLEQLCSQCFIADKNQVDLSFMLDVPKKRKK